ncbi:helix-turn-helix domain-containing protein [Roseibacillus persicicus]|uniref:helix-turn-helix domain-containing protein n=1 Tax=Roseibacillus persicicus TaxID=454148 RepID=UPI00280F9F50|nr:AraC family transcriptional regulator [Roseibacillus persicicus]MDQ8190098.1 AraC family transcriptional regulator [Roseibacillus persicicus]
MPPEKLSTRNNRLRKAVFEAVPGLEVCESLFELINDVRFCIKDREGRYIAANPAFVVRTGLQHRAQLLGRSASELFPALLAAGYEQQDEEIFSTGVSVRDRMEMSTLADGRIGWFITQKIAIRSEGKVIALAGISQDLDSPVEKSRDLGPLGQALNAIRSLSSEGLRIAELADEAGLSGSQFTRRVRSLTGLTPRQLLTKARVEAAADSLRESSKPLSEIAVECGFYDQAAFSRQFRQATGLSPSEYRRELLRS